MARLWVNGLISEPFPIYRGTRQGCIYPLFCLLWAIGRETERGFYGPGPSQWGIWRMCINVCRWYAIIPEWSRFFAVCSILPCRMTNCGRVNRGLLKHTLICCKFYHHLFLKTIYNNLPQWQHLIWQNVRWVEEMAVTSVHTPGCQKLCILIACICTVLESICLKKIVFILDIAQWGFTFPLFECMH